MDEVLNETKNTVVAHNVQRAESVWSRFWGLMGRRALPEGEALHIRHCNSVHTFFMRFTMDAVFLDKGARVVKVVPDMKPFRAAVGGKGAHSVLELAAGAAALAEVEAGDTLIFRASGSVASNRESSE
jgi:uncharacterized membrane protein (UPF0127 family)